MHHSATTTGQDEATRTIPALIGSKFFTDLQFMQAIVTYEDTNDNGDEVPGGTPRMIVVDDAVQLIGAKAHHRAGEGLARLLNLPGGPQGWQTCDVPHVGGWVTRHGGRRCGGRRAV